MQWIVTCDFVDNCSSKLSERSWWNSSYPWFNAVSS